MTLTPEERARRQAFIERHTAEDVEELLDALDAIERALHEEVGNRERAEAVANRLAYAIAPPEVIGEHSNLNDPWANAVEHVTALQHRLDAAERKIEAAVRELVEPFEPGVRIERALSQLHALGVSDGQDSSDEDPHEDPHLAEDGHCMCDRGCCRDGGFCTCPECSCDRTPAPSATAEAPETCGHTEHSDFESLGGRRVGLVRRWGSLATWEPCPSVPTPKGDETT